MYGITWIKYGKPDVSMCLNASLAGLVAITAPCDVTDCFGAICIGFVSGLLVCFGVWLLDYKLHVDDPVGAVAVHMMNGIWVPSPLVYLLRNLLREMTRLLVSSMVADGSSLVFSY